jgi:hypothetical protein
MIFEYIDESDQEHFQKTSHLGMGLLFTRKFGEADGEYRPPADELVGDIEAYLKERSEDPERDPNDTIIPTIMSTLLGYSFVWACGYRWAKSPLGLSHASDVVVSPDERYYLDPVALTLEFLETATPNLKQLLVDAYNGDLPEASSPIQIPIEA